MNEKTLSQHIHMNPEIMLGKPVIRGPIAAASGRPITLLGSVIMGHPDFHESDGPQ